MATLQAQDIDDIVTATLHDLGPPRFSNAAQELQRYPVMKSWLQKERVVIGSGRGIQRTVMDQTLGAADFVGLFEEDDVNVGDHLVAMQVNWIHAQTKFGYDIREESMNSGEAEIAPVIDARRVGALLDMAQILEERAWDVPASSSTKYPWGLPYWCVYNATDGFTGAAPSGHTTVGAINPTTHTNWKNYCATYTSVTESDLIDKMDSASRKTNFISPIGRAAFYGPEGQRFRIYVDDTNYKALKRLARAQNENLGRDVDAFDGQTVFHMIPFEWVPAFDDTSIMASGSNPIYMCDHNAFKVGILRGHYMRVTGPQQSPKQHNVREVFYDLSFQYFCINRRSLALLAKSDPMA